MNDFIHLERDRKDGGLVIRISQIYAFYYRESERRTIIFVGGGTGNNEFCVSGNQTKEICEMIRNAMEGK